MARGEVESWFRAKDAARTANVGEAFSDGEDNNRWSRRKPGETFSVEGGARRRSQSTTIMDQAAEALCCCGPRWGRKYNAMNGPAPSDGLRTKGTWEVNEDDEYYKPPVWKQIILKVKAQARQANCGNGSEWVNYDSQSYEKNFDNGSWRDSSRDLGYHDQENHENKLGLKERAVHTALLQKLASSRSGDGEELIINNSPALSPLPVNRSPPKPKDEFVPIWQRRASSPVTLDVRQRS